MATELWDIYDASGNKTDLIVQRGDTLCAGQYHLVIHIWIYNKAGDFLIQKRAAHLSWASGQWATTGGSAISGEDGLEAAIRETKEELGIILSPQKMRLIGRVRRRESFTDIWVAETDAAIEDCTLEDAVSEIKYSTAGEMKKMIADGDFINYLAGEAYTEEIMEEIFVAPNPSHTEINSFG
jgi:8-oxo-dGTP pyrophosphatase MutT (NUDIX family)